MIIVGLTGGIGSGKSLVARIFASLGVPVYSADAAGRRLLDQNEGVIAKVQDLFGPRAYLNNKADRAYIASQVFGSRKKLDSLNSIIHPAVREDFTEWQNVQKELGSMACIRESAILFESNTHIDCDLILAVTAEDEIRIKRTMLRDGISEAEVRSRMSNQMNQKELADRSDICIDNSGGVAIIPQLVAIYLDQLS